MLKVKNIKVLVSIIFDCQKQIMLNQRLIREKILSGKDISNLENENIELAQRIRVCQEELKIRSTAINWAV